MPAMTLKQIGDELFAAALKYPGAWEDRPWDHRVAKVGTKIFAFVDVVDRELGITVKLPHSGTMALGLPFAEPTGYNMGKSGWISASFTNARQAPVPMLLAWIEESYRAIAPKKLIKELDLRS